MQNTILHRPDLSPLQHFVADWIEEDAIDYEDGTDGVMRDLNYGGCQSGFVGCLVYYSDTTAFYRKHRKEIWALLDRYLDDFGLERTQDLLHDWDGEDRWAEDTHNQNLLAWFAFEATANELFPQ